MSILDDAVGMPCLCLWLVACRATVERRRSPQIGCSACLLFFEFREGHVFGMSISTKVWTTWLAECLQHLPIFFISTKVWTMWSCRAIFCNLRFSCLVSCVWRTVMARSQRGYVLFHGGPQRCADVLSVPMVARSRQNPVRGPEVDGLMTASVSRVACIYGLLKQLVWCIGV